MKKLYLVIFGIIGLGAAYFIYNHHGDNAKTALTPEQQQIQKIGYKCLDFGDRAVAKDIPIIEFQKLERISKRANVIAICMQDNGYKVNPAWLKYAEPITKIEAEKTKVSFDEAITNLSRKDMQVFEPSSGKPDYWIKTSVSKSSN
ncbi:MAG TPA: hypothetical protein VK949_06570 [Methylotenera sp.]|nr:hypothetical protein [Methylotenera sp.]